MYTYVILVIRSVHIKWKIIEMDRLGMSMGTISAVPIVAMFLVLV